MRLQAALRSHGVPGAIGSAALAVGALGLGWLPPLFHVDHVPIVGLLHTTTAGELLARLAVLVGGALVLQAWLLLGSEVIRHPHTDVHRLQRVLALWILPTIFVPPLFSRDPYSYFVQGRLLQLGQDPYTHGASAVTGWFQAGVDPMWAETATPYGPLYLAIQHAVVTVARTPYWSAIGFRIIALFGIALVAHYVPKLATTHGIDPATALWLSALNPLVLLHFSLGGHNDALMVGLMLAGLHYATQKRATAAAIALAAAVAVKPIAFVAVPFAALLFLPAAASLSKRLVSYVVSGTIVLSLVTAAGAAMGVGLGWVHALTTPGSVRTWLSPTTGLGMAIGLVGDAFGNGDVDAIAVTAVRASGMAVAVGVCLWLLLRPAGRSAVRGALLAFSVIVGLGPVVQPWYLLWALPLLAVTGVHKPWHLKATVLGTAAFVIYALAEPTATSDSHLDLIDSLGMVMAGAAVLLVLTASPRERELALGTQYAHGLTPLDPAAQSRSDAMLLR